MSGEALAVLAILLGGYPLLVLLVAVTGPHNATERREQAERRAVRRSADPLDQENARG